jgi:SAM-dependent MidA family methyltransferase
MDAALYGDGGFFASGTGAGRSGRHFVTSPEIGSLFGLCVARALDQLWRALDEPDPFLVIEAGAGSGRLAREVQRAQPACSTALRYVLVERS